MSQEIQYILNGEPCNPKNRKSVNYVLDFSGRRFREVELSVDALEFVREDLDRIKQWRDTYGDYLGMPLQVVYTNGLTIDYLLDFTDESTSFADRLYRVKVLRYRATDNFFDNAAGLSFATVGWQPSDFVNVDYVIVRDNNLAVFISLSLATFSLAQELAKSIQEIAEGISDLVKATVPVGLPPGPDWGAIIVAVIKLAARIAYTIFIIIALIKLCQEIIEIIFPQIRQFKGIKLKRLIEKGCAKLGYTVESTLLDSIPEATILPVPLREKEPSFWKVLFQPLSLAYTYGYPSVRDASISTLGQALDFCENVLNAEIKVLANDVVRIELEQFYEQQASQQINEAFNVQEKLQDDKGINSSEIFKRLTFVWQVDPSDINTFDDTSKSVYETSSEIQTSIGASYELPRRVKSVNVPFARGTRKGSLTFIEEIVKGFAEAIDLFCGSAFAAQIEARADVMQISQQYFNVTKLLYLNGSRLAANQKDFIGAEAIVNNYWTNKFIENNQKDVKKNMPLELTESEFFNIESNNFVTLPDGRTAKITRVVWNDWTCLASIDFETKKPAINETTIVVNAG